MQLRITTPDEACRSLTEATDFNTQLATLRTIKNTLTGHELRKIEYIKAGLISVLDDFFTQFTSSQTSDEHTGSDHDKIALWLHASSIVGILANSGTSFTAPILASDLLQRLLDLLHDTSDVRLQLTILRSLNTIADNLPLQSEREWMPDRSLAAQLFKRENVSQLAKIISSQNTHHEQQAMEAALTLICKTCTREREKRILVETDILNNLCDKVVQFINLQKIPVWQGKRFGYELQHSHGQPHQIQEKANHVSLVLETIALIIEKSESHAQTFVSHAGLLAAMSVLPHTEDDIQNFGSSFSIPPIITIALPTVPDPYSMNAARRSQFPPLSVSSSAQKRRTSAIQSPRDQNSIIVEENDRDEQGEYLIVPWLLYLVRTSGGRRRFAAARLLGILKCHNLMHPTRARSLAALLVPILVHMLLTHNDSDAPGFYGHLVPSVLAMVVKDNEYLQKAAVEVKAIAKCVFALKTSFENQEDIATTLWWPQQLTHKLTDGEPAYCLGPGGPSPRMRKVMTWRQGLLQALASLAPDNESYRKEVVDVGGLPLIMQALEPFSSSIVEGEIKGDSIHVHGNSPEVLIAACGAVRALTRSATSLRTKLVDADVAKPIIKLLQTAEPEVRIAATMVMANLAHDFSPMKQTVEPILRKLCEQAHSANARLRHESLFALKAMANNSKNDLKRKIVEELGPNWIKHLIATDPHDVPAGEVIGLVPKDYRKGSMVRVSGDVRMDIDEDGSWDGNESDDEFNAHSLQEDLDIQAELLGFLRNLTTGERPDEIIEFLLEHIGQDDFLQILVDRLKAGVSQRPLAFSPPSAIIFNSIYILTHLCAADRKYRQTISQNVVLMKQASALLGHSDPLVRCAACWLVTNLVYMNSTENHETLIQRARDLQKMGIMNQIRRMEKSDPVMDVKERAATASECFNKLLDRS
ncbi:hypothetical protein LTR64_005161 [Lithohypha guttulata]|uniref:Armadillo repeat-containing protein 8 n=1 Tax=Lithohypha guttulata TaxID=1690604 RepID=A0AAN7T3X4_9EURO|nr:hypothetical protein LTR51_005006 [Lithohypha guttulata]KAK5087754.1 hypothetical protein LTR05_001969 [Lithohypha guttulata]